MKKKQIEQNLDIKIVNTHGHAYNGRSDLVCQISYGGHFHNTASKLAESFGEAMKNALSVQPVKLVDPQTVSSASELTIYEMRRFKAAKLARKYFWNKKMQPFAIRARRRKLSMQECDYIINLAHCIADSLAAQDE